MPIERNLSVQKLDGPDGLWLVKVSKGRKVEGRLYLASEEISVLLGLLKKEGFRMSCKKCQLDGCVVKEGENVCVCCGTINPKRHITLKLL